MLPQLQDDYLEQGFFRMGHTIKRTRFLFVQHKLWSVVWSRVNLQTFAFRKSQRKLIRRTLGRFALSIGPYEQRDDQDEVYHYYQLAHPLEVGRSIDDVLGNHHPTHEFRTHCLRIEEDGVLVAFSCFDVGDATLSSLFGCYLPEFASLSLGYATMLFEMEHGRSLGLAYYHPGYCVPGCSVFAYKERLPGLEGRTYVADGWRPLSEVVAHPLPHQLMLSALRELRVELTRLELPHSLSYQPLSEMMPVTSDGYGAMPEPVMVRIDYPTLLGEVFVAYDVPRQRYRAWFGQPVMDLELDPDFERTSLELPENSSLRWYEMRAVLFSEVDVQVCAEQLMPKALYAKIIRAVYLARLRGTDARDTSREW